MDGTVSQGSPKFTFKGRWAVGGLTRSCKSSKAPFLIGVRSAKNLLEMILIGTGPRQFLHFHSTLKSFFFNVGPPKDSIHRSRVKSVIRPALYHQATTAGCTLKS